MTTTLPTKEEVKAMLDDGACYYKSKHAGYNWVGDRGRMYRLDSDGECVGYVDRREIPSLDREWAYYEPGATTIDRVEYGETTVNG